MENKAQEPPTLDKNNTESIYNWLSYKITSPAFRNVIKDFIDENCSSFIDVDENTFEQGQLFNEFTQLVENLLTDVLEEGGISQEQFLSFAERGLQDPKYKKYYDQLINFTEYNYFKKLMTKRNYQLIKRLEEELAKAQGIKQTPVQPEVPKKEANNDNNAKLPNETDEEMQRRLLHQFLNQEEEEELQKAIKKSLEEEERKKKLILQEEEELQRAIKQSLLDSEKNKEKKEEQNKEAKKQVFSIEKSQNFKFENKEPEKKPIMNIISSSTNFEFSGTQKKENDKKNIPTNTTAIPNKFDFQIEPQKNINEPKLPITNNINQANNPIKMTNPYANPSLEISKNANLQKKTEIEEQNLSKLPPQKVKEEKLIEPVFEAKKPEEKKVEPIKSDDDKKQNENKPQNNKPIDLLIFEEEKKKDEKVIIAKEIKTDKPSDIVKRSLNNNQIVEENKGGLLIDDDEEEDKNEQDNGPKTNTFIDKSKDINLGKIKLGKPKGNFLNNFSMKGNYEKGGIEKLENIVKEEKVQSVIGTKKEEDEDYKDKLKEVEQEQMNKLKEYREYLLKIKKEKRENKAKEVLSQEELEKLESKKRLAEQLKAKRK